MDKVHLLVKIWVEGELVVSDPVEVADVHLLNDRHLGVCRAANEAGRRFVVEVVDSDEDVIVLRFGNDAKSMQRPIPVLTEALATRLLRSVTEKDSEACPRS